MSQINLNDEIPSLRFHHTHDIDIELHNNNTTARRVTPGTGLVFSSYPLKPYEKMMFKLSEIPNNTKEIVSVGFTTQHPSSNHAPTHSLKVVTLQKQKRVKNKTVYFYYTQLGMIHFAIGDKEKTHFDTRVKNRQSLWAFVHISSPRTTIEILNCSSFDWPNLNLKPMLLHQSRGRNVKLVKNLIYKYDRRLSMSYAFTANPLGIGEHVTIKILDIDCRSSGALVFGLTSCNPSQLEKDLPDDVARFLSRPGQWIVVSDPSWNFKLNDIISLALTPDGKLKIWRNESTLLQEMSVDIDSELWAFVDIAALESVEISSYLVSDFEKSGILGDWKEVKNSMLISDNVNETDDSSLCAVCYEKAIEAALYPCGHMCMCYECAKQQWRGVGHGSCPMCRVKIKDVLKIYKT